MLTIATGELNEGQAERAGLVPTHAYAILNVVEVQVWFAISRKQGILGVGAGFKADPGGGGEEALSQIVNRASLYSCIRIGSMLTTVATKSLTTS